MSLAKPTAFLITAVTLAVSSPAWAQGGGVPGCTNLPDYNRALGALQGMTSACDMSVEEACRILAARGTPAAACQPAPPERGQRRLRQRDSR